MKANSKMKKSKMKNYKMGRKKIKLRVLIFKLKIFKSNKILALTRLVIKMKKMKKIWVMRKKEKNCFLNCKLFMKIRSEIKKN
jgi:hypothetical protein